MQLVSTSKMKQFQELALSSKLYITQLLQILEITFADENIPHSSSIFSEHRESGKRLFILYSSDKGLCGSMNSHLFKGLIHADAWVSTAPEDRILITIGKKASDMARLANIPCFAEWKYVPEKFEMTDIIAMIADIVTYWEDEKNVIQEIYFVVPSFKNAFTFYPQCKKVLPFDPSMAEKFVDTENHAPIDSMFHGYMFYEPDPQRVQDVLYIQILTGIFAEALHQLKATEYSSRMMAMQNATESAQKMIESKTLIYNKVRQQMITQQISEIVNAAEAIL